MHSPLEGTRVQIVKCQLPAASCQLPTANCRKWPSTHSSKWFAGCGDQMRLCKGLLAGPLGGLGRGRQNKIRDPAVQVLSGSIRVQTDWGAAFSLCLACLGPELTVAQNKSGGKSVLLRVSSNPITHKRPYCVDTRKHTPFSLSFVMGARHLNV